MICNADQRSQHIALLLSSLVQASNGGSKSYHQLNLSLYMERIGTPFSQAYACLVGKIAPFQPELRRDSPYTTAMILKTRLMCRSLYSILPLPLHP